MISNRFIGREPDDAASTHYVLGGGHLGTAVARRLAEDEKAVTLVDDHPTESHRELSGTTVVPGDPADVGLLADAGVANASTVVVATRSDSRNLLIAQLVRANFDAEVVVLTNAPDRTDPVTEAGHRPVCATAALSDALVEEA